MNDRLLVEVHGSVDWILRAQRQREDPWRELTVEALLTAPDGSQRRVPAFWNGGDEWRVRLTAEVVGDHRLELICSDPRDQGLHEQRATMVAQAVSGQGGPLRHHGPVRVASDGRSFAHADGTPFLWFGDTWWMVMSGRIGWPEGFSRLAADRAALGFTVAQTVVGFPPDLPPLDGRDANEGGSPWEPGYRRINPAYFAGVDRRLAHLIGLGIMPCILGSWGYHLLASGEQVMASHWRYLVARYAAWPVAWALAGEAAMPYYLAADPPVDSERQRRGWASIARAVRAADPWRRPLSIHPRRNSWDDIAEPGLLDFHMLQAGHMGNALGAAIDSIDACRARFPDRLIVNAEPPYEQHASTNGPDVQRYAFWSSMLAGAAGYTYGAAGIFQANDRERPVGPRPDGGAFDAWTWEDALSFPGVRQLAEGVRLLRSLPFERFEPHPEWIESNLRWGADTYRPPFRVFAAGVPGECRIAYIPLRWYHWDGPLLRGLEVGVTYRAAYVDPETFRRIDLGEVRGDTAGTWRAPTMPYLHDWLVVLTRAQ